MHKLWNVFKKSQNFNPISIQVPSKSFFLVISYFNNWDSYNILNFIPSPHSENVEINNYTSLQCNIYFIHWGFHIDSNDQMKKRFLHLSFNNQKQYGNIGLDEWHLISYWHQRCTICLWYSFKVLQWHNQHRHNDEEYWILYQNIFFFSTIKATWW